MNNDRSIKLQAIYNIHNICTKCPIKLKAVTFLYNC